jgi:hypothetical protein
MPKLDNEAAQISRFKSTSRALECDEDKDRFEAALGKIAAHKPTKEDALKEERSSKNPRRPTADR